MSTEAGRDGGDQSGVVGARRRILVLSTRNPFPPRQGDDVRLVGLLRAAATLGDTTLAVWGDALESGAEEVAVQAFPLSRLARIWGVLCQQLSGQPLIVGPYARGFPMLEGNWDLLIGFQLRTWRWSDALSARIHILDMVDSLSRYALSPELPLSKKLQLHGVGVEERRAITHFDQVWVSTEADRAPLATIPAGQVEVVRNGPLVVSRLPVTDLGKRLLFVGNLRYPPNRQAIAWFISEVWPALYPDDFLLDLVGKGSEEFAKVPGVRAHGLVPEVEPFYAGANLVISPVWWGTGSQLKVWEALGYGRRVVVTPAGGASFEAGPGILIAEGAESWITSIRQAIRSGAEVTVVPPSVTQNFASALTAILGLRKGE